MFEIYFFAFNPFLAGLSLSYICGRGGEDNSFINYDLILAVRLSWNNFQKKFYFQQTLRCDIQYIKSFLCFVKKQTATGKPAPLSPGLLGSF